MILEVLLHVIDWAEQVYREFYCGFEDNMQMSNGR